MASILVVDDDSDSLAILGRIVTAAGFECHAAANGTQCMEMITRQKPDIVLLDVMLPDALGTDLCAEIKKDSTTADIIVILLSGHKIQKEDQISGLEIGADDYLTRPIDPDTLIARINALLRLKDSFAVRRSEDPFQPLTRTTTNETGAVYGRPSIRDAYPEEFQTASEQYSALMATAIKHRELNQVASSAEDARELATRLGFLRAGARDLVMLHKEALGKMLQTADSARMNFYVREEGRILLLQVMGFLVSYYRTQCG